MDILSAFEKTTRKIKEWADKTKADKTTVNLMSEQLKELPNDLVVIEGKLYLAKDGTPLEDSAIELPEGGGGGTSAAITITNKLPSSTLVAASGSEANLVFYFSSTNLGDGTAYIFVTEGNNNRILKGSVPIENGQDNTIDVSAYIGSGTNIVDIVCSDQYGNEGMLKYTVNVIQLSINTPFNDSQVFTKDTGIPISIKFNGSIKKTLHFEVTHPNFNVKEYTVSEITTDNSSVTYDIFKIISDAGDSLSHGTYLTKIYTTATTENGNELISNSYIFDIMFNEGKTTPLISSVCNITSVTQGEQINIPFTVFHTSNLNPEVTLSIEPSEQDGKTYLPDIRTINSGIRQTWSTKSYPTGEVTFTISYSGVKKSHIVNVTPSIIKQQVRIDNMKFYLSALGKSNESSDHDVWMGIDSDNNIVSNTEFNNVNWVVGTKKFSTTTTNDDGEEISTTTQYAIGTGWATDNDGNTALRLSGDARAFIDFKPYAIDPKVNGKTIELIFAIRDVNNRDAVAMSCMSNGVGFTVTSDTTTFTNGSTSAVCNYIDGEKLHITLVIEPQGTDENPNTRLFCAYLNGVMSSAAQYATSEILHQSTPVGITVGSSECSIDLYAIRTYDIALTKEEVRDNFIAESGDIALSIENDIYNGSSMLLSEVEKRIPVMRITGALPSLKKDSNKKKGGKDFPINVVYTDPLNTDLSFVDTALIHVQGTSSENFPRKNWKIEFDNEHQHMPGMIPSDVFCMKTDFAENTGSHNTGNANYVHTFYEDIKTPPQEQDPRVRTTIAGFPCVIFHRKSSSDAYEFAGRYNFNYEKSSNEAYGLTDEYPNAESWEFRENKELPCQFLAEIPDDVDAWNGPIFEARYPDGSEDIESFRVMHEWVLGTNQAEATEDELVGPYTDIDGVIHTNDTAEYRLAKFKTEFENYFDLDFMLVYYLYTFVILMVDQRAKNMFMSTWDKQKWQPWLYDNDTCLGINNEGKLVFDYYHQDYGINSTLGIQDVFNGKSSILWTNFHEAFADEISTMYQSWRVSGSEKLSYDKMVKYFITDQTDRWSISMYNEDAEFKYIANLRNNNNPEYLYQVRGTGEEHFKYFVKNRLMFCDSKWFAGDFVSNDNRIVMRTNTPLVEGKFAPNPTISYKTFSNMYAAVRYGTNTKPIVQYAPRNELVSLGQDVSMQFKDTDTYIFGADQISYLDDLSLLYPSTLNISAATKLIELNVGRAEDGYENPSLTSLSFTNNRLLRKVNVCNCTGFKTKVLDFSLCPNIQEILATGSNITGIDLPDSGYLKIAKLPSTIETLKIVNQKYIQTFECEGYANLKSIRIENSTNIPVRDILSNIIDGNYPNIRIVNMEWNVESAAELSKIINKLIKCKALDASGLAINDTAIVAGRVIVNDTVSNELRALIHQHFPDLVVVDNTGSAFYFIDYLTIDGEIYTTELISDDETPSGPDTNPSDIIMGDHQYVFIEWDMSGFKKNQNNRIPGVWIEQYAIKFYVNSDDVNYIHRQWANVGDAAIDPVSAGLIPTPTKQGTDDLHYTFTGWDNLPTNVQSATSVYAQFANVYPVHYYTTETSTTPYYTQWIIEGSDAYDPIAAGECAIPPDIVTAEEKKLVFSKWNPPGNVTGVMGVYAIYDTYWAARFWNDDNLYLVEWVLDGENVVEPKDYFEDYTNPTKLSTAQYDYTFSSWDGDFEAITEARDYIAIYSNIIRRYNVYFYNDTELLQTKENIQYGSSTSYTGTTPIKLGVDNPEEYVFKGWLPAPESITGETYCYALFKFTGYLFGKLGKTDSEDYGYGTVDSPNWDAINSYWDTIASDVAAYKAGILSEDEFFAKYPIGGRMIVPIELSEGTVTADVEIIAHNHDDLADDSGKAPITFFCADLPQILRRMNETSSNEGGWKSSEMREFTNGDLLDALPEELRAIIAPVYKISDGGANNKTLITTVDSCWLASYNEVGLNSGNNNLSGQGQLYSSIFSNNKETRKKYITDDALTGGWWLRSSYYSTNSNSMFWRVTNSGGSYSDIAFNSFYVAFGFCI